MPSYSTNTTGGKNRYDIGVRLDTTIFRPPLRLFRLGHERPHIINSGAYSSDGNPTPAFKQGMKSLFGPLLWPVEAGENTFSIDCKFVPNASPYPRIIFKANPVLGTFSDTTVDAVAGTAWQTLSGTITLTIAGVLEIYLEVRHTNDPGDPTVIAPYALWDNPADILFLADGLTPAFAHTVVSGGKGTAPLVSTSGGGLVVV